MNSTDEPGKAVGKEIKRLRKIGRLMEAIALGERDLGENGDTARVLCSLGSAYLQAERYDEAERRFNRTLEINPKNEVALTALGQVSIARRDYDEAERRFNRTLEINPKNEVALTALGQVSIARRDYDEAERRFNRTLEINPKDEVALLLIARLSLERGDFPKALATISAQLKQLPHIPTMRIAKLMAEHGIGGANWQQQYDSLLNIGRQGGLFSEKDLKTLVRDHTARQQPESLSPEFFRQLDEVIGEVARSQLFIFAETMYITPINADAAKELGIHAEPKDSYRRNGGSHNGVGNRRN